MNDEHDYKTKLVEHIELLRKQGWQHYDTDDMFRVVAPHQINRGYDSWGASDQWGSTDHVHGAFETEEKDDFKEVAEEYQAALKELEEAQAHVDELRNQLVEMWGEEVESA